jgi:outer membrane lipoprotein SlyB
MKAIILIVSSLFWLCHCARLGAVYERNTARPVNQVVFGQVETVRNITQRQILESEHSGWKTLGAPCWAVCSATSLAAVMAGRFATAVGALAGAAVQQYQSGGSVVENKLVELLIRNEQNGLINVIRITIRPWCS